MLPELDDIERRARAYANRHATVIVRRLGDGKDGIVFLTSGSPLGPSAIKAFAREGGYAREKECYERLAIRGVQSVHGHQVPQILDWDDGLMVIEMTVVHRPFVLDFASAYVDHEPEFPAEVLEERREHWRELFGERWGRVLGIVAAFKKFGISLQDLNPGNIGFEASEGNAGEP